MCYYSVKLNDLIHKYLNGVNGRMILVLRCFGE
jgi:hypothetical protein